MHYIIPAIYTYYTYSQCSGEGDDRGEAYMLCEKKNNNTYTLYIYYNMLLETHKSTPSPSDGRGDGGGDSVYYYSHIGREEYTVRGNNPGDRLQGNCLLIGSAAERGRQV